MARTPEKRAQMKADAQAYLRAVRVTARCVICGKQPVDFHSDRHHHHRHLRPAQRALAGQSIKAIQNEIDHCVAYCRSCHMRMDGRLKKLHENKPRQPGSTIKPTNCSSCGKKAKLQDGICRSCFVARQRQEAESTLPTLRNKRE